MADLNGAKRYIVIDGDADDPVVDMCLQAAKEWFENAGVPEPVERVSALYDMGVYRLAAHYYDQRTVFESGGKPTDAPFGITGIVHQLKDLGVG